MHGLALGMACWILEPSKLLNKQHYYRRKTVWSVPVYETGNWVGETDLYEPLSGPAIE